MLKFSKFIYLAGKLLNESSLTENYLKKRRKEVLTKDYLTSSKYPQFFLRLVGDLDAYDTYLNDAEDRSHNFLYRSFVMHKILGGWRWKSIFQHRKEIIDIVFDESKKGIDFGGSYGPIALHTTIVDFNTPDIFGREVQYKNLLEVDFTPDYIFSSHTLEHIEEIETILQQMQNLLAKNGTLILNLPAYSCVRWRNGIHTNDLFNDHKWTMYLKGTEISEGINKPLVIDELVSKYFDIEKSCYAGDDCIFIVAKNSK